MSLARKNHSIWELPQHDSLCQGRHCSFFYFVLKQLPHLDKDVDAAVDDLLRDDARGVQQAAEGDELHHALAAVALNLVLPLLVAIQLRDAAGVGVQQQVKWGSSARRPRQAHRSCMLFSHNCCGCAAAGHLFTGAGSGTPHSRDAHLLLSLLVLPHLDSPAHKQPSSKASHLRATHSGTVPARCNTAGD